MELIKIAFCGKTYGPPCKVDEVFDFNRFFFSLCVLAFTFLPLHTSSFCFKNYLSCGIELGKNPNSSFDIDQLIDIVFTLQSLGRYVLAKSTTNP